MSSLHTDNMKECTKFPFNKLTCLQDAVCKYPNVQLPQILKHQGHLCFQILASKPTSNIRRKVYSP